MDNTIKDLLDERIKTDIEGLFETEPGSEQKMNEVENLTKLYRLRIDEGEAQKKAFVDIVKLASEFGLGVANIIVVCYWMRNTFKFEETGTITSAAGRSVLNKVLKLIK